MRSFGPEYRAAVLDVWQAFAKRSSRSPAAQSFPEPATNHPALSPAMAAWRSRFVSANRPLPAWDRRLLEAASQPNATLRTVVVQALRAHASGSGAESYDPVGDLVLQYRLEQLAAETPGLPLVFLGNDRGLDTPCGLTDAGLGVLAADGRQRGHARLADWANALA